MIKNAKLQNMFKLSSKVTVYVPATTGINQPIDNTKYVEYVASILSNCFGGATATPAVGMWVSPTEGLVRENTKIVFAYCNDNDLQANIDTIITICEEIKSELTQDAVALEINGEMYFI